MGMELARKPGRIGGILATCTLAFGGWFALAAAAPESPAPLYKDASQPIERRVEDLLSRMTLDEKVAQLVAVWEHKDRIQTPDGHFSAERAIAAFPNGVGQITRPSDRRGVAAPAATGAAGATADQPNRGPRETADYINAAQHWAVERTRLGIPILFHEEALHGYVARDATSFPQAIGLASTWDPALVERVFNVASREMRARAHPGIQECASIAGQLARARHRNDERHGREPIAHVRDPDVAVALHVHLAVFTHVVHAAIVRHEREPLRPAKRMCQAEPSGDDRAQPVGADGDVVVYDPNGHTSIGVGKAHHMNMDYSAWEGYEIDGHVDTVISRGKVVVDDGAYVGTKGDGRYITRGLSQYLT